jgi:hypothetical protein
LTTTSVDRGDLNNKIIVNTFLIWGFFAISHRNFSIDKIPVFVKKTDLRQDAPFLPKERKISKIKKLTPANNKILQGLIPAKGQAGARALPSKKGRSNYGPKFSRS